MHSRACLPTQGRRPGRGGETAEAKAAYELALAKIDPKSPYRAFVQVKFDALGSAQ
jgi:predicted negative regulator of RcsB-dependent stress response